MYLCDIHLAYYKYLKSTLEDLLGKSDGVIVSEVKKLNNFKG